MSRGYFAAQLSWRGGKPIKPTTVIATVAGFGDRLGSGRGIVPVTAPSPTRWADTGWDNPTELLASAEQLLRRICVVGTPARLLGLRALLAELVWEANTGAGT